MMMSKKRPAPRDDASDVAKKLVDVLQTRRQSVYCTSSNAALGGDMGEYSVQFSSVFSSLFHEDYMMGLLQMPKIMSSNEADRLLC